ncbi:MarR family transcriptional regulator [Nocardia sp. NPDC046473]|uniref:MarR family winged helix-turn-helix transcriptional regulator n=1 Tax=Nocardia sp. NPDC046473 TaxID=3155733 RepID=UPI0033FCF745
MAQIGERTAAEELGVLIKQTQAVLNQRMDDALRPLGLNVPQYACLQALSDRPGITGSGLARRAFVSRQSMNVLLQGLEKRDLIERSDESGPRGERATTLTPAAVALLHSARAEVAAIAETMTAPLDANGLAQLHTLLTTCRDALLGDRGRHRDAGVTAS